SLWITSALSMMFGVGLYGIAIGCTVLTLTVLGALRFFDDFIPQLAVAYLEVRFRREAAPTGEELKANWKKLGVRTSIFNHRMLEKGAVIEHSATVRAKGWRDIDRLLNELRDDPDVLEYAMSPRKP